MHKLFTMWLPAAVMAQTVAFQGRTFQFVSAEAMPGKTITGAPYSGEGFTESVQTLADGTRISHKSSSRVYRDSQGRTREERTLGSIGPWAAASDPVRIVTIVDPVAKEIITLNEKDKTATRTKLPGGPGAQIAISAGKQLTVEREVTFNRHIPAHSESDVIKIVGPAGGAAAVPHTMIFRSSGNGQQEALGKQNMEGLAVEGVRVTSTIPAGEMGNDRPLTTVTERWTSPELQVLVRSITKDPQAGEITYRLSSISRAEPAKSQFQIPADYKIEEGEGGIKIKKHF